MPHQITVEVRHFDHCFSDYVSDWSGIVVGIEGSGQTTEEMARAVADEVAATTDDEQFPYGDHAHQLLITAVKGTLKADARFWPVDSDGNDIDTDKDPEAEIPDEQPCYWFRVLVTREPMRIALDNQGSDAHEYGQVLVTCADQGAADDDGYIDGSTWETPRDMAEAYTILTDRPSLVADLEAAGYDVDCSCYCEPDEDDLKRWAANQEREDEQGRAWLAKNAAKT